MTDPRFPNIIDSPGDMEVQTMCFMTDDRITRKNFVDLRLLVDAPRRTGSHVRKGRDPKRHGGACASFAVHRAADADKT